MALAGGGLDLADLDLEVLEGDSVECPDLDEISSDLGESSSSSEAGMASSSSSSMCVGSMICW